MNGLKYLASCFSESLHERFVLLEPVPEDVACLPARDKFRLAVVVSQPSRRNRTRLVGILERMPRPDLAEDDEALVTLSSQQFQVQELEVIGVERIEENVRLEVR